MADVQVTASYLSGGSRWFVQECHAFADSLASTLQLPFQISMGKCHPERTVKGNWAQVAAEWESSVSLARAMVSSYGVA